MYEFFPDLFGLFGVAGVIKGVAHRRAVVAGFPPLPYAIRSTVAEGVFCSSKVEPVESTESASSHAKKGPSVDWLIKA